MRQEREQALIFWDRSNERWIAQFNGKQTWLRHASHIPTAPDYHLKEQFRRQVKDSLMIEFKIVR